MNGFSKKVLLCLEWVIVALKMKRNESSGFTFRSFYKFGPSKKILLVQIHFSYLLNFSSCVVSHLVLHLPQQFALPSLFLQTHFCYVLLLAISSFWSFDLATVFVKIWYHITFFSLVKLWQRNEIIKSTFVLCWHWAVKAFFSFV